MISYIKNLWTSKNITFLFIVLTSLLIIDCSLGGYLGIWRQGYWQSLSDHKFWVWVWKIAEFSVIALVSCLVSGYSTYVANVVGLELRTQLTDKALQIGTFSSIEGGAQRVQEDCATYPALMVSLIGGLLRSIIMIGVFAGIILYELNWFYVVIPIIYALLGTCFAGLIAKPLIFLNYMNQVFEAKFRELLTKNKNTPESYQDVYDNNSTLFIRTKYLNYFQSFYNQITIIFPHLLLSFLFFSGKITFGVFMQCVVSIGEVTNNLSFLINSFADINRFLSCRKRLKESKII